MSERATLLDRARAGNRQAFAELVSPFEDALKRYALTMVGDENTAADLHQETLRRALEKLDGLRSSEALRSWLFAIAINLTRSHLKRAVNQVAQIEETQELARHSALSSVVRREAAEVLAVAIDRLPVLLREAFVLRHVEQIDYEEMAEITGASANTLHVRAHRARHLLRRQLGSIVDTCWREA